jgi:non-specific serine/threonine protein kinase
MGVARSLNNLGLVAYVQGDYATARTLYEESLAIYRQTGDRWGIAVVLNNLGNAAYVQGDYNTAHSRHSESLEIRRAMGNKTGIAWSLNNLGNAAIGRGDYNTARSFYAESTAVHYELRDNTGIAAGVSGLGASAVGTGNAVLGARLLGASEALLQAVGATFEPDDRIPYEFGLASARAQLGEDAFEKARQEGRDMGVEAAIAYALEAVPEIEPLIRVAKASKEPRKPKHVYPNGLSRREVEVLRLLGEGLTNEQLAERLFLSPNTVRAHLYSIYNKLNVKSRNAATRFAFEHNLV